MNLVSFEDLREVVKKLVARQSDGVPVGTVVAFMGATPPPPHTHTHNWLVCNGGEFSQSEYPALYKVLGATVLPDMREAALVGIGQRASGVANHDVFTLGEFKDDQLQNHRHYRYANGSAPDGWSISITATASSNWVPVDSGTVNNGPEMGGVVTDEPTHAYGKGRAGTTTRTKQFGVNYIIKAR